MQPLIASRTIRYDRTTTIALTFVTNNKYGADVTSVYADAGPN